MSHPFDQTQIKIKFKTYEEANAFNLDKKQQLLNKQDHQHTESFEIQNHSPVKPKNMHLSPKADQQQLEQESTGYCFPKFLQCLGSCFIPCKIVCPCLFCSCCLCSTQPLFSQEMISHGILQNWGKYVKILEPGLHVINPISESIIEVNRQTKIIEYEQICLSKDNVQFRIRFVLFYRIANSLDLVYKLGSSDAEVIDCIREIAMGTVRLVIGEQILQNIIDNRIYITEKCKHELNTMLLKWGIYIEACSLKEIFLEAQLEKILSDVAKTRRESEAMLIKFKAQVECSKLIKQISQIINNKASYQIRYLNLISEIFLSSNQKVLLIDMDLDETKIDSYDQKHHLVKPF